MSAPVGAYQPNDLGIYDMSGNVQEWCWDYYETDFYARSPAINPTGPLRGAFKVLRGGSWVALRKSWNVRTASLSTQTGQVQQSAFGCAEMHSRITGKYRKKGDPAGICSGRVH